MAIIKLPTKFSFSKVGKWGLSRAGNILRSKFTGTSQRIVYPYAIWQFEGDLIDYPEPEASAVRRFFIDLDGVTNSFRLPVPGYTRPSDQNFYNAIVPNDGAVIQAAAARATSVKLAIKLAGNGTIKEGEYFNIGNELKVAIRDAVYDVNGYLTIDFKPPLRKAYAANTPIQFLNPFLLAYSPEEDIAIGSVSPPIRHSYKLIAVEDTAALPYRTRGDDYEFYAGFSEGVYRNNGVSYSGAFPADLTYARSGGLYLWDGLKFSLFPANVVPATYQGLWQYPALDNLFTYSDQFNQVQWTKSNGTIAANDAADIIGGNAADKFTPTANNALTGMWAGMAIGPGSENPRTWSYFIKKSSLQRYFQLAVDGSTGYVNFDIQAGTYQAFNGAKGNIIDYGDYWRIVLYGVAFTWSGVTYITAVNNLAAARLSNCATPQAFWIFGAQQTVGSFSDGGPYIATNGGMASIGSSALTIPDLHEAVEYNEIWAATGDWDPATSQQQFGSWFNADGSSFIILTTSNSGQLVCYVLINGAYDFIDGAVLALPAAKQKITVFLARYNGGWRAGAILNGIIYWGPLGWQAKSNTGYTTMSKLSLGASANGNIRNVARKRGTFDTEAKILAGLAEIL